MNPIDLRSDTVTHPGAQMRRAIAEAALGDDVFGDDPTVNRLEAPGAEMFGMQAALFLPTGTQSNLVALMAHCQRGDEYLVGQDAHTYRYEAGGAAVLGSIQPQPLTNQPDGSLALADIEAAIKPDDSHFARTRLLTLENTISGKVLSRAYLESVLALAARRSLGTHLDGARIFIAAIKLGLPVADLCRGFDTVSACLSKGLGAPAGTPSAMVWNVCCGTAPGPPSRWNGCVNRPRASGLREREARPGWQRQPDADTDAIARPPGGTDSATAQTSASLLRGAGTQRAAARGGLRAGAAR